jgi:hypothetical protein
MFFPGLNVMFYVLYPFVTYLLTLPPTGHPVCLMNVKSWISLWNTRFLVS